MRVRVIWFAVFCAVLTAAKPGKIGAQMSMSKMPEPAIGSQVSPAAALHREIGILEMEMVPLAKAMPADKYSFAPSAAIFAGSQKTDFATVRTFGQQVAHVAEANYYFFMSLSGLKPDVDMKALDAMQKDPNVKKDEAVKMLEMSFAFGHKAVETITTANAFEVIKAVDGMNTRVTVAGFAVAHGYDHYGQMVEYLRMNGMKPPSM
ncbi:MAG: DinB family protein [Acidobacteriota bacterium]